MQRSDDNDIATNSGARNWRASVRRCSVGTCLALGLALIIGAIAHVGPLSVHGAFAMGDEPQPVVDCRKRKNRDRPECKKPPSVTDAGGPTTVSSAKLSDDQIYAAGYALANAGQFAKARALFLTAADQSAPRILNYLGFTTRKLGDPKAALTYYEQALKAKPDYAVARSYYGEALVETGRVDAAREQLTKIRAICGTTCEAYVALAEKLEATRKQRG